MLAHPGPCADLSSRIPVVIVLCPCLRILDRVLISVAVICHTPKPHVFRHCSRDSPEKEWKSVFMEFSFIFSVNFCFRMITNFQISWRALRRTWLYPKPRESKLPTGMPHLSSVLGCVFPRNKSTFKNIRSIAIYIRGYRCCIVIVWLSDNPCHFANHRTESSGEGRHSSASGGASPRLPGSAAVLSLSGLFWLWHFGRLWTCYFTACPSCGRWSPVSIFIDFCFEFNSFCLLTLHLICSSFLVFFFFILFFFILF